ncbi:Immunity protein Imm1 [Prauserella aidingensis]|uniref:Imm1 family immunity protein n=1 Tax=Prauserella aidingensis TaxID=387890 RepID=UPI0020A51B16|nr:Imm1 family immunity protein [Prauserella aidingensis]MCP2255494.1 Immunity protein Imm1 [Prauserella aidingensis]
MVALDAWYDHDGPARVTTAAELDAVLDTVAAMPGPTLVAFNAADDPASAGLLNIGLCSERGVGVVHHAGRGRGYFSLGEASNADTVLYYYMGSDTEFPPQSEIPIADVRRAAHEYLVTGARPTSSIRSQLDDRSTV